MGPGPLQGSIRMVLFSLFGWGRFFWLRVMTVRPRFFGVGYWFVLPRLAMMRSRWGRIVGRKRNVDMQLSSCRNSRENSGTECRCERSRELHLSIDWTRNARILLRVSETKCNFCEAAS